jgi:hypothetical protein
MHQGDKRFPPERGLTPAEWLYDKNSKKQRVNISRPLNGIIPAIPPNFIQQEKQLNDDPEQCGSRSYYARAA